MMKRFIEEELFEIESALEEPNKKQKLEETDEEKTQSEEEETQDENEGQVDKSLVIEHLIKLLENSKIYIHMCSYCGWVDKQAKFHRCKICNEFLCNQNCSNNICENCRKLKK